MDKITLEFTKEEIRQLRKICYSSLLYEPYGSRIALNAVDFYDKFSEIEMELIKNTLNRDNIGKDVEND